MKRSIVLSALAVLAATAFADFYVSGHEDAPPDATHAWGINDANQPKPVRVDNNFGGVPTDALVFVSPDEVKAGFATDCQLHFSCRSLDALAYFGTPLACAAKPGKDGWITVDAVLHAGSEGHAGYAMVFANGIFRGETVVKPASGAKPLAISGQEVCRLWARPSPPPWAEKLMGRYADTKLVAEKRRETAERILVIHDGMSEHLPGNRWGEGKHGFARRRMEAIITAYAFCRDEKFEKRFREECDAYVPLMLADKEKKTFASPSNLTSIIRRLYPLYLDKSIGWDHLLWKTLVRDMKLTPWGGEVK